MPVEYINVIIKRQFWCVCAITENCAGCVWLKCSSGSKNSSVSYRPYFFFPHSWYFTLVHWLDFQVSHLIIVLFNSTFLLLNYSLPLSDHSDTSLDIWPMDLFCKSLIPLRITSQGPTHNSFISTHVSLAYHNDICS